MFITRDLSFRSIRITGIALVTSMLVTVCSAETKAKDWRVYGGSNENIKYSPLNQITTSNVKTLKPAWRYLSSQASATNRTDMKVNPLIVDGVLYGLNPQLKVFALDAATGREKW